MSVADLALRGGGRLAVDPDADLHFIFGDVESGLPACWKPCSSSTRPERARWQPWKRSHKSIKDRPGALLFRRRRRDLLNDQSSSNARRPVEKVDFRRHIVIVDHGSRINFSDTRAPCRSSMTSPRILDDAKRHRRVGGFCRQE